MTPQKFLALASGISWILILTFTSTSFSFPLKIIWFVEEGRSRFRNRVFGIVGGLLILTFPKFSRALE